MKYAEALSEGEVQKINGKAAREWIDRNKSNIKAKPNKTLIYSGRDFELEVLERGLKGEDRKTFMGTPMYKRISELLKHKAEAAFDFETINVVLKRLKSPVIIDRDRINKSFANADECFQELLRMPKLIQKKTVDECWALMSQAFVANAKGAVAAMDGCADDYRLIGRDKIFIDKELEGLLKNPNLSTEAKKMLRDKIGKYGAEFDRRYTSLMKQLMADKEILKGHHK